MFWSDRDHEIDSKAFLFAGPLQKTYQEVFNSADHLYAGTTRGLVVILCDKSIDTIEAYVGALRNNLVPLMLDSNIKLGPLQRYLSNYKPDYIFSAKIVRPLGYVEFKVSETSVLYRRVDNQPTELHPDLSLLLPTSGSTGDPKCVRITQQNVQTCTEAICDYLEMDSSRRSVSLLPLHYSYGLSVLNTVMNSRASFVITAESILDRKFWSTMESEGITDFSGVPFMFELLVRMRIPDNVMFNLKCVTQAGGRLEPKFTKLCLEKFMSAGVRYFTMYGQTEASPRISFLSPELGREKYGSVGKSIACGNAYIAETGEAYGEGELVYTGPNVCMGYAKTIQDLSLGDELNGVLHTGDHARMDEDGCIFIIGRRKRFIKLQGVSVNLDYVESVLKSYNLNCMVIGDENKIIICFNELEVSYLSNLIEQNFNFHPSTIKYIEVRNLPLNSSGKPDHARLTSEYL